MTLRLGFVGVGKWSQKLATAFRACGAEIVAHCRRQGSPPKAGWVKAMHWADMIADPSIDAIIAVAPPEVTTEVAMACAAAGKAVMATKPLFDHPETIRAPFYVDFWRLWSEAHTAGSDYRSFDLHGSGPVRDYPGTFDYGPHVMAAVLDKFPEAKMDPNYSDVQTMRTPHGELRSVRFYCSRDRVVTALFGNGSLLPERKIWGKVETATHIGAELKSDVLQRFCQSFLNDISEGFVDTRLLNLSRDGMRELRRIREMATASDPTRR